VKGHDRTDKKKKKKWLLAGNAKPEIKTSGKGEICREIGKRFVRQLHGIKTITPQGPVLKGKQNRLWCPDNRRRKMRLSWETGEDDPKGT